MGNLDYLVLEPVSTSAVHSQKSIFDEVRISVWGFEEVWEKFYRLLTRSFVMCLPLIAAPGIAPALVLSGWFIAPEAMAGGFGTFWLALTKGMSQSNFELVVGPIEVVIH
jgi:hypothetical protein